MRSGSVVRVTSSVAGAGTIQACRNVQFVGEKTLTILFSTDSLFLLFVFSPFNM